jgi:hypothetical protein
MIFRKEKLARKLQNSRRSLLGDFADLWHLMQTSCSKEYVNLHQIPNLGKIARKSIGRIVLQFLLKIYLFTLPQESFYATSSQG